MTESHVAYLGWPCTCYIAEDNFELLVLWSPALSNTEFTGVWPPCQVYVVLGIKPRIMHSRQAFYPLSHIPSPGLFLVILYLLNCNMFSLSTSFHLNGSKTKVPKPDCGKGGVWLPTHPPLSWPG